MRNSALALSIAIGMVAWHGGHQAFSQKSKPDQGKAPLPSPIIKELESNYSYTIRFAYLKGENTGAANPKNEKNSDPNALIKPEDPYFRSFKFPDQITITRTAPYSSVRFSTPSGKETMGYFLYGKYTFTQKVRDKNPRMVPLPVRDPLDPDFLTTGEEILLEASQNKFYGFNWVSNKTYIGEEVVGGVPCFVFRKEKVQAWIDQKKHRPVQWKSEDEVRHYTYNKPSPNHIPQVVMKDMEALESDIERLTKSRKGG